MPRRPDNAPPASFCPRLQLGPDLGARLQAVAERNERTLTSEVTMAVKAWVASQERAAEGSV